MCGMTESVAERLWPSVNRTAGCWEWTGPAFRGGYGRVYFRGRTLYAHRVSWELANGRIPDGLWVLHHCDNPPCVRPDHLFLGTHADNMADMVAKGRHSSLMHPEAVVRGDRHPSRTKPWTRPRGERHAMARLNTEQVMEIRRRYVAGGWTQEQLGFAFGITESNISRIVRDKNWRHLPLTSDLRGGATDAA